MELSFYFGIVCDRNFKRIIFENLNLSKIKFFGSNSNFGAIWIRTNVQQTWLVIICAYNIEVQRQSDLSKLARDQSYF